jgi:hypothetical protein
VKFIYSILLVAFLTAFNTAVASVSLEQNKIEMVHINVRSIEYIANQKNNSPSKPWNGEGKEICKEAILSRFRLTVDQTGAR